MASTVHQLKVTIHETKPPVWRRVLVPSTMTLGQLHDVLQAAFGWWDSHLHEYEIAGERYGMADLDDFEDPPLDEHRVQIGDVGAEGVAFEYVYDFGDHWQHKIIVEKVASADDKQSLPALIDGRRACPPEDCGGTHGYGEFLQAIGDPEHEEHDSMLEWAGGTFDPQNADLDGFAGRLAEQTAART